MKSTTKLLLGATLVAGLSISAFAACATDVNMGAKKLTNVADGTDSMDAVNVGQIQGKVFTFTVDANTTATINLANTTLTFPNGETYEFKSNASAQIGCSRLGGNYGNYAINISEQSNYRTGFNVGSKSGSYGTLSVTTNSVFNRLYIKDTSETHNTSCRFSVN